MNSTISYIGMLNESTSKVDLDDVYSFNFIASGYVPLWTQIIYTSYLAIMFIFGLLGNAIIVVVYSRKTPKTSCDWFILFIANLDCIVCLVSPILGVRLEFDVKIKYLSAFVCGLEHLWQLTAMSASCFILSVMALERYIRVCHPTMKYMTPKAARNVSIGCIIFALCYSAYPTFVRFQDNGSCSTLDGLDRMTLLNIYAYFVMFLICLFTVVFAYVNIIVKIEMKIKVKKRLLSTQSGSGRSYAPEESSYYNEHPNHREFDEKEDNDGDNNGELILSKYDNENFLAPPTNSRINKKINNGNHSSVLPIHNIENVETGYPATNTDTNNSKQNYIQKPMHQVILSGSISNRKSEEGLLPVSSQNKNNSESSPTHPSTHPLISDSISDCDIMSNHTKTIGILTEKDCRDSSEFTSSQNNLLNNISDQSNSYTVNERGNTIGIIDNPLAFVEVDDNRYDDITDNINIDDGEERHNNQINSPHSLTKSNSLYEMSKENGKLCDDIIEMKRNASTISFSTDIKVINHDNITTSSDKVNHLSVMIDKNRSNSPTRDGDELQILNDDESVNSDHSHSEVLVSKAKKALNSLQHRISGGGGTKNSCERRQQKMWMRERQTTLMLMSITIVFLCTWIPTWLLYLLAQHHVLIFPLGSMELRVMYRHVDKIFLLNYFVNFPIYYRFNSSFRDSVKALIPKCFRNVACRRCNKRSMDNSSSDV